MLCHMFGYTVPVESLLSDDARRIYRSYYCETCHHLREEYGYVSTLTVNYEMTFTNLFFNSILEDGMLIDNRPGGKFCIFRHSASSDELMHRLTAYTVLVANNSLLDDVSDDPNSVKGKMGLLFLNPSIRKAVKEFPEYNRAIIEGYDRLRGAEKNGEKDPMLMGRYSSQSMIDVLDMMLGDRMDDDIRGLFRGFGVWVYVMDAIEDLDKDFEEGDYNPFLVGNDGFRDKKEYVRNNIFPIGELMGKCIEDIQIQYVKLRPRLRFNQEILDNIIYQVHMYHPDSFTHQGVGTRPVGIRWPDESKGWNRADLRATLAPVRDFQRRHDAKIYVGEFSAIAWAPGAEEYLRACIDLFEEYGWDWTYHAFREWDAWSLEREPDGPRSVRPSADNPRKRVVLEALRKNEASRPGEPQ